MKDLMKNIKKAEVLKLKEEVSYQDGQIVSKTLAQNPAVSITLFSFAKGEEISTHESGGDAFVTCLDGVGEVTIDGVKYEQFTEKNSSKCCWSLYSKYRLRRDFCCRSHRQLQQQHRKR